MGILDFTAIEFLQGFFSFIIVFITFLTGILIALKYFKTRKLTFLTIGLAWSGIIAGWIPDSVNFFLIIFNQPILSLTLYLVIAVGLYPPVLLLWVIGITELLKVNKRKIYLILFLLYSIITEIFFFLFLIIDEKGLLGNYISTFIIDFEIFSIFILFFSLIVIILSGLKFSLAAYNSSEAEVKLKGKLLLFAFISVSIGVVLDLLLVSLSPVLIVITRLIIAISSIALYCGFILPKWVKILFLKQK
ncbi:MAG: hypothetical protein EU541_06125 [Promethearchaeota archaeon]|nr:MAG: hypothetical protein EU541_06125 [Candidatus Lokiarchaeota archaeon]